MLFYFLPLQIKGFVTSWGAGGDNQQPGFWMKLLGPKNLAPAGASAVATTMRIEPKTYFANERTFLSWLHMAVTLGSIAAALLGFSNTKGQASHWLAD